MPKQNRDPALNGPDTPLKVKQAELEGNASSDDKVAYIEQSQVEHARELTRTEIYEGELEAGSGADLPGDPQQPELLTDLELRAGETDDVQQAIEEGQTYVPPIDPPITWGASGDLQNARIAAGTGMSAQDELFADVEDDLPARVRSALRADSRTSTYADQITIDNQDGTIILRGDVADLIDEDNLLAVTMYIAGVQEVVDQLTVRH